MFPKINLDYYKDLVAKNDLDIAISKLLAFDSLPSVLQEEVVLISRLFEATMKNFSLGVISDEEKAVKNNRIGRSLIEVLKRINSFQLEEERGRYILSFAEYLQSHENGENALFSIEKLLFSKDFPKEMNIDGFTVNNPVYDFLPKSKVDKLIKTYKLEKKLFRIMPLDLFLVKAIDSHNQPMLLCYFSGLGLSGWQTWLFPHRGTNKNVNKTERFKEHVKDFSTLLRLEETAVEIEYSKSNDYVVSFKPDFGYGGLVLYVFFPCFVSIDNPPSNLLNMEFNIRKGKSNRTFRWFYVEELLSDSKILHKNADLVRSIHTMYETSLAKIPLSFNAKIKSD